MSNFLLNRPEPNLLQEWFQFHYSNMEVITGFILQSLEVSIIIEYLNINQFFIVYGWWHCVFMLALALLVIMPCFGRVLCIMVTCVGMGLPTDYSNELCLTMKVLSHFMLAMILLALLIHSRKPNVRSNYSAPELEV
jgi:hypothetical protein